MGLVAKEIHNGPRTGLDLGHIRYVCPTHHHFEPAEYSILFVSRRDRIYYPLPSGRQSAAAPFLRGHIRRDFRPSHFHIERHRHFLDWPKSVVIPNRNPHSQPCQTDG